MRQAAVFSLASVSLILLQVSCSGGRKVAEPAVPPPTKPPPARTPEPALPPAGKPAQATPPPEAARAVRFWEAWFSGTYEYTFAEPRPGCEPIREYCGGTNGLISYGGGFRALAMAWGIRKVPQRHVAIALLDDEASAIFYEVSRLLLLKRGAAFAVLTRAAIKWLAEHLVPPPDAKLTIAVPTPSAENQPLVTASASQIYHCVFERTVRAYAKAYVVLRRHGFQQEVRLYQSKARSGSGLSDWLNQRYGTWLPAQLRPRDTGYGTCNKPGYIFGFWLRRMQDRTAPLLARALHDFLLRYDRPFLASLGGDAGLLAGR